MLQNSPNEQLVSLWEEYDGIQGLICRLRDLQVACPETNRADHFPVFEKWLKENGAIYHENVCTFKWLVFQQCYYVIHL